MFKILKILTVNLLLFLIGLVVLELLFGDFLTNNALTRLNLIRNREISYDLNGIYESDTGYATYKRDKYGLRGSYPSLDKIDILTLGGSSADQRFITEGKTWQDRMRHVWLEQGKEVSVVNAGVDGQSSLGHLKNFKWWFPHLPNLKARFILFYIGVNDLFGNAGTVWDEIENRSAMLKTLPAEERQQLPELTEATSSNSFVRNWASFKDKSALFYLYRTINGMLAARRVKLDHRRGFQRQAQHWTSEQKLSNHFQVVENDLAIYRQRVKQLILAAKEMNARPIIVTQTAHYFIKNENGLQGFNDRGFRFKYLEVLGVDIYYFLKLYSDVAIDVCNQEVDCISVNLFDELDFVVGDFYDNVHNTPQGSDKIARYLVKNLDTYL